MSQRFSAIVIAPGRSDRRWPDSLRRLDVGRDHRAQTIRHAHKALVAGADAAHIERRGTEYGFAFDWPLRIAMAWVQARAAAVSVGDATLTAPHIFINAGGCASVPDTLGTGDVLFLTNSST